MQSLIGGDDDADDALRSVCRPASKCITRRSHAENIYKSVYGLDSGSADSAFNFLLIFTSFSSFSSLSSQRPLLRLLFLTHL